MRSSSRVVRKEVPVEETTFCDSMWACLLNDYGDDEDHSIRTETEQRSEPKMRSRAGGDARSSRRSSSRSVSKTRSRSKSRNADRDGRRRSKSRTSDRGGRRHSRRGSASSQRSQTHSRPPRRDSLPRRESRDSLRVEDREEYEHGRDEVPTREEPVRAVEEELPIPPAPSRELRSSHSPEDSNSNRQANDEPTEERTPAEDKPTTTKKERNRPEKLTIMGEERDAAPGRRDEPPPVLFRSIKNRYNPRSPNAQHSPRSPRVPSPVSSPRSPSHLRVDSAEFNTIEDYQKKVLEARDKRSGGRKFDRIRAIRAKSATTVNKFDP
ncbi:MAG: hypothetical protein SGBAC_008044 [Bacillariaceae sp.]